MKNTITLIALLFISTLSIAQSSHRQDLTSFLKYGDGGDVVSVFAHPLYEVNYTSVYVGSGYVDLSITYKGRMVDYTDVYRLYWDRYDQDFSRISVRADGNFWTPAFSLFEIINEVLKDSNDSAMWDQFRNKMTGSDAVRAFTLLTLNREWSRYKMNKGYASY